MPATRSVKSLEQMSRNSRMKLSKIKSKVLS
jgi:hypothetical protein